jgi:hypothetical protein
MSTIRNGLLAFFHMNDDLQDHQTSTTPPRCRGETNAYQHHVCFLFPKRALKIFRHISGLPAPTPARKSTQPKPQNINNQIGATEKMDIPSFLNGPLLSVHQPRP